MFVFAFYHIKRKVLNTSNVNSITDHIKLLEYKVLILEEACSFAFICHNLQTFMFSQENSFMFTYVTL